MAQKILFLTRFDQQGASSRMRLFQYLPWLEAATIKYVVSPFVDDEMLLRKYSHGGYSLLSLLLAYWRRIHVLVVLHQFDLVWIEKEALPWLPAWAERWLLHGVPYVLDFDDAIFHNYDLHPSAWVRYIYGRRIDSLMAGSALVIAGNRYLADRAIAAGARRVEIVPTVVDLARYASKLEYSATTKLRIVWIGSPSTTQYLQELSAPLGELAKRHNFTLRVIGGGLIDLLGVDVELMDWSIETEAAAIAECDIGIMPLRDTPWEQGKCAYKLIQYMACGLPTVTSPIGANIDVVVENETGFFAAVHSDWVSKLGLLLSDKSLRQRLGQAGRLRVNESYSLQQAAPKLIDLFTEVLVQ